MYKLKRDFFGGSMFSFINFFTNLSDTNVKIFTLSIGLFGTLLGALLTHYFSNKREYEKYFKELYKETYQPKTDQLFRLNNIPITVKGRKAYIEEVINNLILYITEIKHKCSPAVLSKYYKALELKEHIRDIETHNIEAKTNENLIKIDAGLGYSKEYYEELILYNIKLMIIIYAKDMYRTMKQANLNNIETRLIFSNIFINLYKYTIDYTKIPNSLKYRYFYHKICNKFIHIFIFLTKYFRL